MTYSADQINQIEPCATVTVHTVDGTQFSGLFDGCFAVPATGEVKGCQVYSRQRELRFFEPAEIEKVTV